MSFSCVRVRRVRLALLAGVLAFAATTVAPTDADARRSHRGRSHQAARSVYSPPYAAMVVDANTGRVMHASNEDELRHPASVTKVMTLYLLFEQIERGNLQLTSELEVSRHAASMAPSKLGLRPGETIEVEDAIKALVTRSANDVAAAIAENIAGSEEDFAARMTRKARQLGMSRTVYRNASGLPDRAQVTTARDLVILGRAVQERFPRLYKYFQTKSFEYAGQVIGNHNRLLGRVEGVDGIKTGFTNASGFNLMTSARLDGRHVVGVVLGGRSGASRDAIMANLIRSTLARASASGKSSVFANLSERREEAEPAAVRMAAVDVETTAALPAADSRPKKPLDLAAARTPLAPSAAGLPASVKPVPLPPSAAFAYASGSSESARAAEIPQKIDGRLPPMPAVPIAPEAPSRTELPTAKPLPVRAVERAVEPEAVRDVPAAKTGPTSSWVIQLAAEENEAKARDLLEQAKATSGRLLAGAAPFTEKVVRGGATLYRARFSGFSEADSAQDACKTLKSRGFACFATRS